MLSFAVFYFFYTRWPLSAAVFDDLAGGQGAISKPLRELGVSSVDAALANVLGYSAGVVNSFVWNRYWTFKARDRAGSQLRRFLLLNVACLLLSSASLFAFTDYLGWAYKGVWLVTMTVVTGLNFGLSKVWVFER